MRPAARRCRRGWLMAGLAILKHMHDLSDEVLCERWVENPYYQLFCGEEFFCHQRGSASRSPLRASPLDEQGRRSGRASPGRDRSVRIADTFRVEAALKD